MRSIKLFSLVCLFFLYESSFADNQSSYCGMNESEMIDSLNDVKRSGSADHELEYYSDMFRNGLICDGEQFTLSEIVKINLIDVIAQAVRNGAFIESSTYETFHEYAVERLNAPDRRVKIRAISLLASYDRPSDYLAILDMFEDRDLAVFRTAVLSSLSMCEQYSDESFIPALVVLGEGRRLEAEKIQRDFISFSRATGRCGKKNN